MAKRKKEISEFGEYLEQMIKETGMFKSDFYAAVGIKKPYFYEILTGSPPPQDTLETMIVVIEKELGPDEKRRRKFYDLAAKCRQEIPSDIGEMINAHPESWEAIRTALTTLLTAQE